SHAVVSAPIDPAGQSVVVAAAANGGHVPATDAPDPAAVVRSVAASPVIDESDPDVAARNDVAAPDCRASAIVPDAAVPIVVAVLANCGSDPDAAVPSAVAFPESCGFDPGAVVPHVVVVVAGPAPVSRRVLVDPAVADFGAAPVRLAFPLALFPVRLILVIALLA